MSEHRPAKPEPDPRELEAGADELPVVARMVVEIRSDGTRTIARGAVEDRLQGQQVAVEAEAGSPLELSRALAKLLLSAPLTALLRGAQGGPVEGRSAVAAASGDERLRDRVVGAVGRALGRGLDRARGVREPDTRPLRGRHSRGEERGED